MYNFWTGYFLCAPSTDGRKQLLSSITFKYCLLYLKKKKDDEVGEKAILMLEQVIWSCSDYQSRNLFRFLSRIIYLCWILCSIAFKLHSEGNRKLKGEKQLRNDEICGSLLLSSLLASKIYSFYPLQILQLQWKELFRLEIYEWQMQWASRT